MTPAHSSPCSITRSLRGLRGVVKLHQIMKRYYYESRNGCICVIDRTTDKVVVYCHEGGVQEAKAHVRGLNR